MDRDEHIGQAAIIWHSARIFAYQEDKTFEEKLRENGVITTKEGKTHLVSEDAVTTKEGKTYLVGEDGVTTQEVVNTRTFEEALREYDVTEEEIRKYLDEHGLDDPTDESGPGCLGVLAVVILAIVVLSLVI